MFGFVFVFVFCPQRLVQRAKLTVKEKDEKGGFVDLDWIGLVGLD